MFTGIIKELGRVRRFGKLQDIHRLEIEYSLIKEIKIGDSISVNGACLTVVGTDRNVLEFNVSGETVRRTNLGSLRNKDFVNMEESLKIGDRLSGHFVSGHVDCTGILKEIERKSGDLSMEFCVPKEFMHLVVQKGSIAIDGVSLTVGELAGDRFSVYLIPHTLRTTTLGFKSAGDSVNVEFDMLGKYAAGLKGPAGKSEITEEFLREKGFA